MAQPAVVPVTRAPHVNLGLVGLVALGGMVGTSARYALTSSIPHDGGWPIATFLENVLGSFLLGLLLETLLRKGNESQAGRRVRLGVGTGVLGGFTTYSSLALETDRLLADGAVLTAATYALTSVMLGLLACFGGVALAATVHRRRHPEKARVPHQLKRDDEPPPLPRGEPKP